MDDDVEVVEQEVNQENTNALGGTIPQAEPTDNNPPWQSQLEKFPESVRHIARDAFTEWDKGTQQRFTAIQEKYKPYQSFVDQGVDAEKLNSAYGLSQLLEQDPPAFTRLLAKELGLTIQEAEAVAEEMAPDDNSDLDPRIVQMQQQQQGLMDYIQNRDQEEQTARDIQQQEQSLTAELDQIERQFGVMTLEVKNQVMREALRLSVEHNAPVTMTEAYNSLESFVNSIRSAPRPGQNAPRILSSGGSVPIVPKGKTMGKMSNEETQNMVAEHLARMLAEG